MNLKAYRTLAICFLVSLPNGMLLSQSFRADVEVRAADGFVVIEETLNPVCAKESTCLGDIRREAVDFLGRLRVKIENKIETVIHTVPDVIERRKEIILPKIADSEWVASQSISLQEMIKDKSFLKSAWVSFDEHKVIWKAKWTKPAMFNYGMILRPALARQFQPGDWLEFESSDGPGVLAKNKDDLVVIRDGHSQVLNAKDLSRLLEQKIKVDGVEFSLDNSGNLILEASGDKARELAKIKT